MKTLSALFLLVMAAAASSQDGGKLAWRGKTEDPKAALADARSQGRAALLFFTSHGCKYCSIISEGAFSNPDVVDATSGLTCIFIDCDWGKKNEELANQFKVTGYPTIAFCDPSGKDIGRLKGREPAEVLREVREITRKYPSVPGAAGAPERPAYRLYDGKTLGVAAKASKLVALFFFDDSQASDTVSHSLSDRFVRDLVDRTVLAQVEYKKDSALCVRCGVTRAPTVLILDPAKPKPEEDPKGRITGSRSPRELRRDLEEILSASPSPSAAQDSAVPSAAAGTPAQTLSDDEVDRKFITARLAMAIDLVKKGKKDKALEMLEDLVVTFPKHVETLAVKKYIDELKAQK